MYFDIHTQPQNGDKIRKTVLCSLTCTTPRNRLYKFGNLQQLPHLLLANIVPFTLHPSFVSVVSFVVACHRATASGANTVSYTHLDVYKRQILFSSVQFLQDNLIYFVLTE